MYRVTLHYQYSLYLDIRCIVFGSEIKECIWRKNYTKFGRNYPETIDMKNRGVFKIEGNTTKSLKKMSTQVVQRNRPYILIFFFKKQYTLHLRNGQSIKYPPKNKTIIGAYFLDSISTYCMYQHKVD
jgi:hypothetical protein